MGDLASIARNSMKAVVQIHAQGHDDQDIQSILDPRYNVPISWTGSGFFIKWEDEEGLILTNSHVVRNAEKIHVKSLLTSEENFKAEIVGLVPSHEPDLALIRIKKEDQARFKEVSGQEIPYLRIDQDVEVCRGLELKAIGYPFGLPEPNMSGGEVTNFLSSNGELSERLVTDAAINPGNSGGPSLVEGGVVIGVNTSIIVNSNNMGFITPIQYARILIPQFLASKSTELSSLGAKYQVNSLKNAEYLKCSSIDGVIITHVYKSGALATAGIERFDILKSVNDYDFDRYGNLKEIRGNHKINIFDVMKALPLGEKVSVVIERKGDVLIKEIETRPFPDEGLRSKPLVHKRRFIEIGGALIQELNLEILYSLSDVLEMDYKEKIQKYKLPLLVFTYIDLDSEAEALQFMPGDIITHVNSKRVNTLDELLELSNTNFKSGKGFLFLEDNKGSFGGFEVKKPITIQWAKDHF